MLDRTPEFSDQLDRFLVNVEAVGLRRLRQRGGAFDQDLSPLLSGVTSELRSPTAREDFRQAVAASTEEDDGVTLGYLTRELGFFNALVEDPGSGTSAKTIKESVEKWRKVKGRWKRLLEVLDELLSLIKGGS